MKIVAASVGAHGISTLLEQADLMGFVEKFTVSTIYRPDLKLYQTCILAGPNLSMLYRIEQPSMLDAAKEHLDTVDMALTELWPNWSGTKPYQDQFLNQSNSETARSQASPSRKLFWANQDVLLVLRASDIEFVLRPDAYAPRRRQIMYGAFEILLSYIFYYFHGHGFIRYFTTIGVFWFAFAGLWSLRSAVFRSREQVSLELYGEAPAWGLQPSS